MAHSREDSFGCDHPGPNARFRLMVIQASPLAGAYAYRSNCKGECGKWGAESTPQARSLRVNQLPLSLPMIGRGFCFLWRAESRYKSHTWSPPCRQAVDADAGLVENAVMHSDFGEGVALCPRWNLRAGASSSARARGALTLAGFPNSGLTGSPSLFGRLRTRRQAFSLFVYGVRVKRVGPWPSQEHGPAGSRGHAPTTHGQSVRLCWPRPPPRCSDGSVRPAWPARFGRRPFCVAPLAGPGAPRGS